MNAFDSSLKGLDTSKQGTVVQTVTSGGLDMVTKGGARFVGTTGLYASFVRGECLSGTIGMDDDSGTSTPMEEYKMSERKSDRRKDRNETKEERRARKAAKRAKRAARANRGTAAEDDSSEGAKDTVPEKAETKEERRERRRLKKATKEAERKSTEASPETEQKKKRRKD